jgi:hypothetical protein
MRLKMLLKNYAGGSVCTTSRYSYRNATIGSIREARRAGR